MRSILVVTDLSSSEMDVAVQRAAHLARAHNATLKLMYLPSRQAAPPAEAAILLARAARKLGREWQLRTMSVACTTGNLRDVAWEELGSDLVVFPDRRNRSSLPFFLDSPSSVCSRPAVALSCLPARCHGRATVGS